MHALNLVYTAIVFHGMFKKPPIDMIRSIFQTEAREKTH
jgi:hypothetical protein